MINFEFWIAIMTSSTFEVMNPSVTATRLVLFSLAGDAR